MISVTSEESGSNSRGTFYSLTVLCPVISTLLGTKKRSVMSSNKVNPVEKLLISKKELAKLFVDSFNTGIKKVITSGELEGCGGTVEQRKRGEVIFSNYASYEKREFSNDYRNFAKKLAEIHGVDWHEIKLPMTDKKRYKSFYYQWDPDQVIAIAGIKFKMCRKMMNMPHAILDGCSHTYYIDIDDMELVEEIKKLNDERVAAERRKKEEDFPGKVENARKQCLEIIEELTKWANGDFLFTNDAVLRINNAHFDICSMLVCDRP